MLKILDPRVSNTRTGETKCEREASDGVRTGRLPVVVVGGTPPSAGGVKSGVVLASGDRVGDTTEDTKSK